MLIIDSLNKPAIDRMAAAEKNRQEQQRFLEEQTALSVVDEDSRYSPLNDVAKLGKMMSAVQLEARLAKLNPSLRFLWFFNNNKYKKIGIALPGGDVKDLGIVYEATIMPERSTRKKVVRYAFDPSYMGVAGKKVNSKDFPKMEWVPRPLYHGVRQGGQDKVRRSLSAQAPDGAGASPGQAPRS